MKRLDPVIRLMAAVKCITERFKRDNLNEYAAYSALFIVLSFVPFLMLILTIINKFPIFSDTGAYDINLFSDDVTAFFQQILAETEQKATGALLSVSTIVALWSASRALIGLINGLNRNHREKETTGIKRLRIAADYLMIFFIVAALIMLFLLVCGLAILDRILLCFPAMENLDGFWFSMRWAVGFCILILLFLFLYTALPIHKGKPISKLPGAVFSAAGWVGFSALYSFYINHFADYSRLYGSLTTIVLLILWLYICMYILFLGEELNIMLSSKYIGKITRWVFNKKTDEQAKLNEDL